MQIYECFFNKSDVPTVDRITGILCIFVPRIEVTLDTKY